MDPPQKKPVDPALLERLAKARAVKAQRAKELAEKKAAAVQQLDGIVEDAVEPVDAEPEPVIEVSTEPPAVVPPSSAPPSVPKKKKKKSRVALVESSTDSSDTSDSEAEEVLKRRKKSSSSEPSRDFSLELEKAKQKYRERYKSRYERSAHHHHKVAPVEPVEVVEVPAPVRRVKVAATKPSNMSNFTSAVDRQVLEAAIKDILRL